MCTRETERENRENERAEKTAKKRIVIGKVCSLYLQLVLDSCSYLIALKCSLKKIL